MGDHGQLHGLELLAVDGAAVVGGRQVGDADHRDLVDGLERAEAGAVADVADVLVGRDAVGQGGHVAAREAHRAGGRALDGAGGGLQADQLRLLADHGGGVGLASPGGDVLEGLLQVAAPPDDDGEHVGRRFLLALGLLRVGDLDGDVVAGRARLEGGDRVGRLLVVGRRPQCGLGLDAGGGALAALGPDADDVGVAAAVHEVAVDAVGQVGALDEVAEGVGELGPVGDERGLVERAGRGDADEGGDRGSYSFDGPAPGVDLLDVDTG